MKQNEQETIDFIIKNAKNIAIVGLSNDENKPSFRVAKFLQENGYKIFPIYPKNDEILGEKVYRSLDEIKADIDLVLMFRKGAFASELLPSVIKKNIKNFWLQLGIVNNEVSIDCEKYGINFVQDKCIMIEIMQKED